MHRNRKTSHNHALTKFLHMGKRMKKFSAKVWKLCRTHIWHTNVAQCGTHKQPQNNQPNAPTANPTVNASRTGWKSWFFPLGIENAKSQKFQQTKVCQNVEIRTGMSSSQRGDSNRMGLDENSPWGGRSKIFCWCLADDWQTENSKTARTLRH